MGGCAPRSKLPLLEFRKRGTGACAPFRTGRVGGARPAGGGGFWLFSPQTALAGEVVDHVVHEAVAGSAHEALSAAELGAVLRQAGVTFDTSMPVVYAMACPFRGRRRAAPGGADRRTVR